MSQKIRIVNYAINGSGVGHLTRLVAINRWIRRYAAYCGVKAEVYFLSSSEADGLLFGERFASFKLPSKTVVKDAGIGKPAYLALAKQWVWHSLGLLRPDLFVVDTFPRGSFGELLSALDLAKQRAFIYRPLKDETAERADFQAMLPLYDAIVVPDHEADAPVQAPEAAQDRIRHVGPVMIREACERLPRAEARAQLGVPDGRLAVYLTAGGGGDPRSEATLLAAIEALRGDPDLHLVVGAGPLYRGRRVYGERITWLAGGCAAELLDGVDLALSAAGFNSFFELMHAGVPTLFLPQEKVADDQALRAGRAVERGAGRLLTSLDELPARVAELRDASVRAAMSAAARSLAPRNNARAAAAELLRLVLPAAHVEAAEEAVNDELLVAARDMGIELETCFEVMALLDPRPRDTLDAEEAGAVSEQATDLLRFVAEAKIPLPAALRVVGPLCRKLVLARPAERAEAARAVLEAFLPFADWPGAAMVLKSLRIERELDADALAELLGAFLAGLHERGEDLYRGLAQLANAQGDGELPTNGELLKAALAPEATSSVGAGFTPARVPRGSEPGGGKPRPYMDSVPNPTPRKPKPLQSLNEGRPLSGPRSVHIDITNGCNTNCVTCWDHSPHLTTPQSAEWKRQRVSAAEVEALLDDILSLGGLEAVVVSGMGDPFTHPEIYRIIAAVKQRGLHLTIITNLIPADPERVLELDVDQLLIGIHGASEEAYRAFHPSFSSDEWERLHERLERFHAAGRRYKHVQVICSHNAHELLGMVELGARYGAERVNFKLASLKNGTEAVRITDAQRARLRGDVIVAQATARALGVTTNLDVFARQLEAGGAATAPIAEVGCLLGYAYARILVDGTVLYCCNTDVVVGHLRDAPFSELWDGESWNTLRARLRRGEYFESCSQCGKINQNVKLAAKFAEAFGEQRLAEVTGRKLELAR